MEVAIGQIFPRGKGTYIFNSTLRFNFVKYGALNDFDRV